MVVGHIFAKPSTWMLDFARTGWVMVSLAKMSAAAGDGQLAKNDDSMTVAVGPVLAKQGSKNGGRWWRSCKKEQQYSLFLQNQASRRSILQEWGWVVVRSLGAPCCKTEHLDAQFCKNRGKWWLALPKTTAVLGVGGRVNFPGTPGFSPNHWKYY